MTSRLRIPRDQIRERIEVAIEDAESVRVSSALAVMEPAYRSWDAKVSIFLDSAFEKSGGWLEVTPKDDYVSAAGLEYPFGLDFVEHATVEGIRKDLDTKVGRLQHLLSVLDEYTVAAGVPEAATDSGSGDIFIIHGRDESARMKLEILVLKRLGRAAIVLADEPNRGATVIEKLEAAFASASFAIAILTADDVGGLRVADETPKLQPRARQNVLLELGYAMGRFGRDRTAVLLEDGVELPSDMGGIAWYELDKSGRWQDQMLGELQAAGFEVGSE
ncbi:TIR domain-containing protein [Gordonia rubripertincta]|uniref:TIR domain-containing protein n=1 Tax=Gordonia rubripertincta TaxID=36822 RepID=UPI0015FB06A7|nr:nucleotide-binding protein [Gordonia rubripertincta]QMU22881.1 nucleotide-binding protein [Gordonia rubripertincta]